MNAEKINVVRLPNNKIIRLNFQVKEDEVRKWHDGRGVKSVQGFGEKT
jgi:hypothetical protein